MRCGTPNMATHTFWRMQEWRSPCEAAECRPPGCLREESQRRDIQTSAPNSAMKDDCSSNSSKIEKSCDLLRRALGNRSESFEVRDSAEKETPICARRLLNQRRL